VRDVEVRYAEHEGKCLAYEVFGEGPTDLLIHQVCYPIDLTWDLPQLSDFMDSLGECARVIAFDSRGEGASDPIDDPGAATLEAWCDDVFAVLDAAGADRVTVFDMTTGVGGIMLAATYPDRVRSLILSHLWTSNPDLRDMSASDLRQASREFCSVESLEVDNPRVAHDPVLRQLGSCPSAVAQSRSGLRLLPMGWPYGRRAAAVECPRSDARVAPPRQSRVRHRDESPGGGQDSRCTVRWASGL
jgi:pimeloyl-ACP methyl ester carboxylesterase